jgi:hypothetical protein
MPRHCSSKAQPLPQVPAAVHANGRHPPAIDHFASPATSKRRPVSPYQQPTDLPPNRDRRYRKREMSNLLHRERRTGGI